jgi:hypothetical protein
VNEKKVMLIVAIGQRTKRWSICVDFVSPANLGGAKRKQNRVCYDEQFVRLCYGSFTDGSSTTKSEQKTEIQVN